MARALVSNSSITGEVKIFAGVNAPEGFFICDGRAVSRTAYARLFSVLGTTHGTGDGSTTFNLPDYRGQFLRGKVDITTITGSGTASSNNATFTNHGVNRTGFKVRLSSGTLSGLVTNTDYYAIVVDSNTLAFATSRANAIAGTKIVLSGANSAVIVQYEDPHYSSRINNAQEDNTKIPNGVIIRVGSFSGTDGEYDANAVSSTANANDLASWPNNITGTNQAPYSETRPKNVIVNYIIKY